MSAGRMVLTLTPGKKFGVADSYPESASRLRDKRRAVEAEKSVEDIGRERGSTLAHLAAIAYGRQHPRRLAAASLEARGHINRDTSTVLQALIERHRWRRSADRTRSQRAAARGPTIIPSDCLANARKAETASVAATPGAAPGDLRAESCDAAATSSAFRFARRERTGQYLFELDPIARNPPPPRASFP